MRMSSSLARPVGDIDQGTDERRPAHLLLLYPGPLSAPEQYFGGRLELLSRAFEGVAVALAEQPTELHIGRFEVNAAAYPFTSGIRRFGRLLRVAVRAVRRMRRAGRPIDLVVSYDPLSTGLVGWLVARLAGAALVVEVNGDYTAWANYDDVPNALVRRIKRYIYTSVERFVLARADGAKLMYQGQAVPFGRALRGKVVRMFPNFVELTAFHWLEDTPELLLVGFPFRVKGVDLLIDAFKRVADRFPDWHVKILGWYPDTSEIEQAIGGHPRIRHHPPVEHDDVPDHIGRCGVLVLPSRTEGVARVLLEAMAASKPCIASAVGGIPSVIENGVNGLLVEPENAEALAQALVRLMGDPELRRRMGLNGVARVHAEYGPEAYLARLVEFYGRVSEHSAQRGSSRRSQPLRSDAAPAFRSVVSDTESRDQRE